MEDCCQPVPDYPKFEPLPIGGAFHWSVYLVMLLIFVGFVLYLHLRGRYHKWRKGE